MNGLAWADIICYLALWLWLTECLPIGCGNPGPVSPRMSLAISFSIVGCLGWATRKLESLQQTNTNYPTLLHTLLHHITACRHPKDSLPLSLLPTSF